MHEAAPFARARAAALRLLTAATGSPRSRVVLIAAAGVILAVMLLVLYGRAHGDELRQNEVLGWLRELKEIDARWDVELLRTRLELAPAEAPDYAPQVNRLRKALTAAANETRSPVLT